MDCLCCEAIKGSNIYRVILKATGSKEQILFYMALKCLEEARWSKKNYAKKFIVVHEQTAVSCLYVYYIYIGNSELES